MVLAGREVLAVTVASAAQVVKVVALLAAARVVSVVRRSKTPSLRAKSLQVTSRRTQPDRFNRCIKASRDGRKTVPFCFGKSFGLPLPCRGFR